MEKRWTWRPKDQRIAQNEQILDAVSPGEVPGDIAARLRVTRNTVSGVIARARAAGDPRASVSSVWAARRVAKQAPVDKQAGQVDHSQE